MENYIVTALKQFRGDDHVERNRLMAKFCRVNNETASHWGRTRLPKGEALNKLWFFLSAHGTQIPELERLNPTVRYVGKLLAYDVIGVEDALNFFSSGSHSHLWVVLHGGSVPYPVRKEELQLEELEQQFETKLREAQAQTVSRGLIPQGSAVTMPTLEAIPQDSYITIAAAFISGLRPLLGRIDAEGDLAVEALRAAIDYDMFHDVLDLLKSMSSRKAREYYKGIRM